MNTILLKVQQYLDSVSKKPSKLDEKLVEEFGEACKNALLKQFQEERSSKFELRSAVATSIDVFNANSGFIDQKSTAGINS